MISVKVLAENTYNAYNEFLEKGSTKLKNEVLKTIAKEISNQKALLVKANQKDLEIGKKDGLGKAFLDRLHLNDKRIEGMIKACEDVAMLPDPVGKIREMIVRPEGFKVGRMQGPIGVIGIIYEARPNVTVEAAILCFKSGNGVILRGGSSSFHSNMALVQILKKALKIHGIDEYLISYIESKEHTAVDEMLNQEEFIHLIIPRGGEGLIKSVVEKSKIPVLKHYKGVCHVYVNEKADLKMAAKITMNAKVQRPSVCNSVETLLVDRSVASEFLPLVLADLQDQGVEIRGCEETRSIYSKNVKTATEDDWKEEFLDLILAVRVVENIDQAIDHINRYGSAHTDAIITKDIELANRFLNTVDSASVMINASTRLSDGGLYGLGAEVGISTDRLHARGPMGLEELTSYKWVVLGEGHIRE